MNAERLLVHYEKIADAPDAIARLRRFILDLAVRGKLVPQDPKDEPASELLKRIAAEKAQLDRRERTKRKQRNLTGDAVPAPLPTGWASAPLADLVTVLNGRAYKQHELLSAGTPVLRVGNLFTSDRWYYSNLQLEEDKYCGKGDLIFAWSASFGPFIWSGEKVIYHYHIWKLPLHSETDLDKLFLYNFLLQKTREIKESGHGISMIHMTKEKMELIPVPLPPLAEQHRIVAKVDELMALCDRLEAARTEREATRDKLAASSLARLNTPDSETFQDDARFALDALSALTTRPDQIKQLRQTILNLAVRGKLVPQDPKDEPASEWLHNAFVSENVGRGKKSKSNLVSAMEGVNAGYSLPTSWLWMELGGLVTVMDAGWSPQCESHPRVDTTRWGVLKTTAVQTLAFDCGQHKELPEKFKPRPQHEAKVGDILVTRAGPKNRVGVSCAVDKTEPRLMISDKLIRLCLVDGLSPRFFALTLNAGISNAAIEDAKSGMAVMQMNISQDKLRAVPVPLPPLAEQHRIVAKVDELMVLCDGLEASLTASAAIRRRLLDALLAEALAPTETHEIAA